MYLLDTNVVSEIRKVEEGRADARVAATLAPRSTLLLLPSPVTYVDRTVADVRN